jgi:exportin-7
MICTGCCNTLDHIVTYVFRQLTVKGKKARKVVEQQQGAQLIRLMEIRPELLQQMLSCIMMDGIEMNVTAKNRDRYTISNWLFLVHINIVKFIVQTHFRFTENLSLFWRDVNESLKGPVNNPLISNNDMMT